LAEKHLGIPRLLDVKDFVDDPDARPEEKTIMTYLAEFPEAFRRAGKGLSLSDEMKKT